MCVVFRVATLPWNHGKIWNPGKTWREALFGLKPWKLALLVMFFSIKNPGN
jgi:hypothetical protein